jgi:small neutral amino acid transporter SnatA (MarC family)
MKAIAVRAFALVAVVAGGFLGQALLGSWNITIPALLLAGGVTAMVLQVLGAVLVVLQVDLAVEMILRGLHELGLL